MIFAWGPRQYGTISQISIEYPDSGVSLEIDTRVTQKGISLHKFTNQINMRDVLLLNFRVTKPGDEFNDQSIIEKNEIASISQVVNRRINLYASADINRSYLNHPEWIDVAKYSLENAHSVGKTNSSLQLTNCLYSEIFDIEETSGSKNFRLVSFVVLILLQVLWIWGMPYKSSSIEK